MKIFRGRYGPRALEQRFGRLRIARAGADVAEDLERVGLIRVAAKQLGAGGFRLGPGAGFVGRDGAADVIFDSDDVVSLGMAFLASRKLASSICSGS